ncbi:hypothetical protein FRUB_09433 [Fimbriiglobus ruber]|uniref:Uncharacterized protein n=1 Tax=Fimbriiglobus ruber TaxID=1908690 RepID=A0A225D181_9BACT|nr:hypothetical protein FRUB_09433 [Fimbriiglobus ruber]
MAGGSRPGRCERVRAAGDRGERIRTHGRRVGHTRACPRQLGAWDGEGGTACRSPRPNEWAARRIGWVGPGTQPVTGCPRPRIVECGHRVCGSTGVGRARARPGVGWGLFRPPTDPSQGEGRSGDETTRETEDKKGLTSPRLHSRPSSAAPPLKQLHHYRAVMRRGLLQRLTCYCEVVVRTSPAVGQPHAADEAPTS